MRHLLTHTSGIGYWRRWSDLARPGFGSGIHARRPVPSLVDYYRRGLPVEIQPGTKWVYSNHGFATLGQIVTDVTGQSFDRYLRDHVFDPLGMAHTDLVRSERVTAALATGYVMGRRGPRAAAEGEVPTAAGGAAYSTSTDIARYVVALLGGGANEHGAVLKPATMTSMFEPHFQTDARVPGMGLGFELDEEDGRRVAGKGGILSGFLSHVSLAPEDEDDPYAFRVDFAAWGKPTFRVAFSRTAGDTPAWRVEGAGMSMRKRPHALSPKRLLGGGAAAAAGAVGVRYGRRAARRRVSHQGG